MRSHDSVATCERYQRNISVFRAGLGDEEDDQTTDEHRHHQRRRRHNKVLQEQHVDTGRTLSRERLGSRANEHNIYISVGTYLRDDLRGEAHHGEAARPHDEDDACLLAAVLAPHGQRRRRDPGADA